MIESAGFTLTAWSIRCNTAAKSSDAFGSWGIGFECNGMSCDQTDCWKPLVKYQALNWEIYVFHVPPIVCYEIRCRNHNAQSAGLIKQLFKIQPVKKDQYWLKNNWLYQHKLRNKSFKGRLKGDRDRKLTFICRQPYPARRNGVAPIQLGRTFLILASPEGSGCATMITGTERSKNS